jgi:hypothetical protein
LPALTGPVGGDPVGGPQPGAAAPITTSPAEQPARQRNFLRLSVEAPSFVNGLLFLA